MTFVRMLPCLFFCLLVSAAVRPVAALPATNVDLLVRAVEETTEEALSEMETAAGESDGTVLILPEERHPANWMVEQILADRLLARGYSVILDSTAAGPDDVRLTFRIIDLGISGRAGLFGGRVERRARAELVFSRIRNGVLQWRKDLTRIVGDRVLRKQVELFSGASQGFAKLKLEEQSLGRFVEPVIVSTVLGSLVYLFFSSR